MLKFALLLLVTLSFNSSASTFRQDMLSPVTTDAAPFFWTGSLATAYLLVTRKDISDHATKDTSDGKPLGSTSQIGDLFGQVYPNAAYFLFWLGHGMVTDKRTSYWRAVHMFKATLYASITVTALKYTVREPRPGSPHERNSFPSGHTTTAFAFGTVVALEHDWGWGFLALTGAAFTGYSRMNDGRHYLHDVVGGITLGTSYALGTYFTSIGQGRSWAVLPILDGDRNGLRIVGVF